MKISRVVFAVVMSAGVLLSGAGRVHAQQGAKPAEPLPVPLKVTVSISRWEGEKRTANLPFALWVNTGGSANVQMGSDVPVPEMQMSEKLATPVQSFRYRSLGTNITCAATALGDGLYHLKVDVNDTQVFRMSATAGAQPGGPIFQNFRSSNSPILRDGQSVQFAVATDKTSGEVIKLDVTLNLVK